MTRLNQECEPVGAIEVHGLSFESRAVTLSKLHKVLPSSGCWMVAYKRSRDATEYRFEIELGAALELYCGLMHTGLQLTDPAHRTLTELCMLRIHERMLNSQSRSLRVRLVITFFRFDEEAAGFMLASSRGC